MVMMMSPLAFYIQSSTINVSSNWHKILGFCIILFISWQARAQLVISQVSNWQEDLDATDLSTPEEAGMDLNGTLETTSNFNQFDILNVATSQDWKITVSKSDINWPGAFIPYVQRTSNGTPCGTCSGVNIGGSVTGYLQITNLDQDFILGTGEVTDIDVQFKVEGISLTVDADNYSTEIIFTLFGD